ncbi:MAG: dTDP-4-dehydrorhamnose reductase [Paracoccaceae bacterium]
MVEKPSYAQHVVMLLGSSGQLGRAIRARKMPGFDVISVSREEMNLSDLSSIQRVVDDIRPDLILNAAAFTAIDQAEAEPELALTVNARAVEMLARSAKAVGAAFLHVSTDQVFDGGLDRPYHETDHAAPLNMYGATKLLGEELAQLACPRTAILRSSTLHAPWGRNLVRKSIEMVMDGQEVNALADRVVSATSVEMLASVCTSITPKLIGADNYADFWGVTHCAALDACSEADLARTALTMSGLSQASVRPVKSTDCPTAAARPRATALDCARLRRVFDIHPSTWRDQLSATVSELSRKFAPEAA